MHIKLLVGYSSWHSALVFAGTELLYIAARNNNGRPQSGILNAHVLFACSTEVLRLSSLTKGQ